MDTDEISHEVFIGTETGTFKQFSTVLKKGKDINDIEKLTLGDEILCLQWKNEKEEEILIGNKRGDVKSFFINTGKFKNHKKVVVKDKVVGLCCLDKTLVTASETGIVTLWKSNSVLKELNAGSPLSNMKQNIYERSNLGTGGNENPLKIWDLNTGNVIFTAKNIPNDKLQLRVPVWVSDIAFLDETLVATASRYNNVCLYDIRVQRRPITRIEVENSTYSCLTTCHREKTIVAGGGKGLVNMIDLRKSGRVLHKYKGPIGGVTDLKCSTEGPYLFSTSLDRRLRIHNLNTTGLLGEHYLKSRLNCLVIKPLKVEKDENVEHDTLEEYEQNENQEDILVENSNIYEDESDGEVENIPTKRKTKQDKKKKKIRNKE